MKNFYKNSSICLSLFFYFIFIFLNIIVNSICFVKAESYLDQTSTYYVYDEQDNLLAQRYFVEEGDIIITNSLEEYEIYYVNYIEHIAFAKNTGYYIEPNIINEDKPNIRFSSPIKKSVGLYMTHNDESFTPTDGYSSIYGKGGIHDVTKRLKQEFENLGYTVYFDETLHLPHDSKAYSRSVTTAKKLLENNIDALFDIHRDGVSRSVYVKNIDGVERCKVRIVVGQANPYKDANLQFAMFLVSVAKEYCPWLFLDIYYAKGHYNQELTSKGLLFEMGTYLAEKDLVLNSTPYLANVIDKTLFSTVVEDDETLVIKDEKTATEQENNVNNILTQINNNQIEQKQNNKFRITIVLFTSTFLITSIFLIFKIKKIKANKRIKSK